MLGCEERTIKWMSDQTSFPRGALNMRLITRERSERGTCAGKISCQPEGRTSKRVSLDLFFMVLGRNCELGVCIHSVSVTGIIKNIFSYETVSWSIFYFCEEKP